MIGEQFKGRWQAEPRTQFQPVKTDEKFHEKFPSPVSYGYLRMVPGHSHPWMAYCRYRHDWLLRVLAANGVDVRQFQPPSKKVTKGKCREIARVLERIRQEKPGSIGEPLLLDHDIQFWGHCGGVRIHDWRSCRELARGRKD
jgi:hypothetical protein